MGGLTGVYSCRTPLDVHGLKNPLITEHNPLRTEPLHTGTRSGVRRITIQVQCVSFIEDGHPSGYWWPESYVYMYISKRIQVLILIHIMKE